MTNLQTVGASCTVRDSDVAHATDAEQDQFITEVADKLTETLRRMVAGATPRSELKFWVTGPHNDPLQGIIHAHHLAALFDMDTLPTDCDAYRIHVTEQGADPNVAAIAIQGNGKDQR